MFTAENITVDFSYKKVLTGVNISFEKGQIYSILGENGAGKSTFAHILCGDLKPDWGRLLLDGTEVSFSNPHQALQKGIACLHQLPLLADNISVKENILLGAGKISSTDIDKQLKYWIPEVNKNTLVKKLSPSQKLFTALCGILLKNPQILILDEPSALITEEQNLKLFSKLKEYAASGMTIIIITHYIKEALNFSNKIVILNKGIIEAVDDSSQFTEEKIQQLLFKKTVNSQNDLNYDSSVFNNSNIEYSLISEDPLTGMSDNKIRQLRKAGTVIIPSDRTFRGSNPNLTILQLVTTYKTELNQKALIEYAEKIIKKATINIRINEKAKALSGGMLQRLILERELDNNPSTVIFCSPFQGLDVAACKKLQNRIEELIRQGIKVIIT